MRVFRITPYYCSYHKVTQVRIEEQRKLFGLKYWKHVINVGTITEAKYIVREIKHS